VSCTVVAGIRGADVRYRRVIENFCSTFGDDLVAEFPHELVRRKSISKSFAKAYTPPGGFGNWFKWGMQIGGHRGRFECAWFAKGDLSAACRSSCSASEIMSVGGWRNSREVETYIAAAGQKKLAEAAMARLDLSNQPSRLDNSSHKSLK
jgi:hypothetical protein